jgi:RNA polymerase sigma-70 factor (ECF subfamily)
MAQMVRFVALNQLRKHTRNSASSLDESDARAHALPHRVQSADSGLQLGAHGEIPDGQSSFDDDLIHGLHELTDIARACLLLRTIEGLDYEQIGQVLGIPQGTAMSHVHRSRMRLREHLLSRSQQQADQEKRRA